MHSKPVLLTQTQLTPAKYAPNKRHSAHHWCTLHCGKTSVTFIICINMQNLHPFITPQKHVYATEQVINLLQQSNSYN